MHMDIETKLDLIREVGEEIVTEPELRDLLDTKQHPIAYDGFEPSGTIHIAQGILRTINIQKMQKAGIRFKMLVADWHGWANNKMGGDLDRIQTVGKYFIEVWKACGLDVGQVDFVWANDLVAERRYWKTVMQISRHTTVKRIMRCGQIMGRKEGEVLQASQVLYPCMQCADIFELKADICQLGMDQRKVNMLAREVGPKLGFWKPVSISHHMLMGLGAPASEEKDAVERAIELKMSKSKPDTAIFMTDSEADIARKINKAYCPEKTVMENPIMEYCRHIIFQKYPAIDIHRPAKWGGDMHIGSYQELERLYTGGELHPQDLKQSVARYVNELVMPVREHFEKNKRAREILATVQSYEVTR
jgi:tyrosyl-tRNA synthetase